LVVDVLVLEDDPPEVMAADATKTSKFPKKDTLIMIFDDHKPPK
jgi:hypothetical protein